MAAVDASYERHKERMLERDPTWIPVEERLSIRDPLFALCELFELDPTYVAEVRIKPDTACFVLFRGREGRCRGHKYVECGEAAMETLSFWVRS